MKSPVGLVSGSFLALLLHPTANRCTQTDGDRTQAFFKKMEAARHADGTASCCELRIMLFAERTADRQLASIMPTNALRNAAMLAVQTPLAAMLDADLGISHTFNDLVSNSSWCVRASRVRKP